MKKALMVLPLFLIACNGFVGAKIGLQMGRAGLGVARLGFDEAAKAKKEECLKKGAEGSPEFIKCYAKMAKAEVIVAKSEQSAKAAFDVAEAGIKAAELKKEGQQIDWQDLLKKGACFVAETLEFIPDKHKKKVQLYLDLMKAYGCKK
jgi:hypothetical protein